jgi:oligopeptide transport system substrate-binding protein
MVKEDTELRMFENHELDWLGSPLSNIPLDSLNTFRQDQMLKSKPMLGTYFLRLNTQKKVLKNTKIRKALAIAIDRKAIVDHILQGDQCTATGLVPISMGLQSLPYFQDHDVEEAKMLFKKGLAEEGLGINKFKEITMIFPSGEKNYLIAQALQQQWLESLGIHITIKSIEKKVYFDMLSNQNFDIAAGSWVADFNDPINFLEVFKYKTASTNNTSWEDKQYIRLLEESSSLADPDERKLFLAQCEDLLIKQMPIIPIFHYNMLFASHGNLKDMILSSLGNLDFKWAYIEDKDL